jgi:hypothetical protein
MKNTYRIYQVIFLSLIIIALSGCAEKNGTANIPESDCPIPAPQQFQYVGSDALANAISADVGRVSASVVGDSEKRIIVFEERHDSRAGQIEIAIMFNRLHDKGLKVIALEGALVTDDLYPSWFHRLPNVRAKQEVAVQLLKEGEISAAEFIALLYPDVKIYGVENPKEYSVIASENASFSQYSYLVAIAEKNMSQDQIRKANQLYEQENYTEFFEFVTNASTCTKRWYKYLNDENKSFTIEEEISVLKDIKKGATLVNAEINQRTKADFEDWIESFRTASTRSDTIIANTLILLKDANAPIALNIGAGHTSKVSKLLNDNRATYAIIAPNSLTDTNDISKLNSSAYNRKFENLSIHENGMLGSFLDGRYLFSWDDIPGNDNGRLIEFLKRKFVIDWVETANIEKIDNGNAIKVSTEKNSLLLKLNLSDNKTVNLKIDDGRTNEFIVRIESGKRNIYDERKPPPLPEVLKESESELRYIATRLARGAASGINPPFDVKEDELSLLKNVKVNPTSINRVYLFSWDNIPGDDNEKLKEFLKHYDIGWVETANIEKIDDDKTIRLYFGNNFLSLRLNDEKTKINLKIDDGRTDEFIARLENGKLNIYDNDITFTAEVLDNNEKKITIYARVDPKIEGKEEKLEEHIKEVSKNVKDEDHIKEDDIRKSKGLVEIAPGMLARFSPDPNSIKTPLI